MFIGLIIIFVGVLLLLEVIVPGFSVDFSLIWPFVLIFIAINGFIKNRKINCFSVIVLFIGIWFLVLNLGYIGETLKNAFWPIIIILIGLCIVFDTVKIGEIKKRTSNKVETNYYGIFSGSDEKINTNDFKGTNVYAIFGGVDLDLRDSKLKDDEAVINVYSIFGGATILVPDGYNIIMSSSNVFGGNDNKTRNKYDEKQKTIYINCISVFGGTEIK